jgi:hypothetical protein
VGLSVKRNYQTFTAAFQRDPDPKRGFREIKGTSATGINQFWVNFPLVSETTGREIRVGDAQELTAFVTKQLAILKQELGSEKLFVVESVPTMVGSNSPLDCLALPFVSSQNCADAPLCDKSISGRSEIDDGGAGDAGSATFLNPFDSLCDNVSCKMVLVWGSQIVVHSFRTPLIGALQAQDFPAIVVAAETLSDKRSIR